ncbi:MAG: hypothetical protein LBV20_03835 [Treponema sp.]|jgi:transketolase|nr:hypothetical protein [Treponema sp.]
MDHLQIPEHYKNVTFEEFWLSMQEIRESQKETAEAMKELREAQKETAREFDRQVKEYNKRFGDFTNRFGEMVEYMVAPNLLNRFYDLGLNFQEAAPRKVISDQVNDIFMEIDYFLENGDKAMLVEVKSNLTSEDVKDHITRLAKMRIFANTKGDKRTFMGAVAGVVMTPETKMYALKQGFYVIEPSGETFNITSPEGKPKEW